MPMAFLEYDCLYSAQTSKILYYFRIVFLYFVLRKWHSQNIIKLEIQDDSMGTPILLK